METAPDDALIGRLLRKLVDGPYVDDDREFHTVTGSERAELAAEAAARRSRGTSARQPPEPRNRSIMRRSFLVGRPAPGARIDGGATNSGGGGGGLWST